MPQDGSLAQNVQRLNAVTAKFDALERAVRGIIEGSGLVGTFAARVEPEIIS